MTRKTKGRNRWHGATLFTSDCHNSIASNIKRLIVGLAIRGLLPAHLAGWMIQHGGMRDA
jgi:hypothetical protein